MDRLIDALINVDMHFWAEGIKGMTISLSNDDYEKVQLAFNRSFSVDAVARMMTDHGLVIGNITILPEKPDGAEIH